MKHDTSVTHSPETVAGHHNIGTAFPTNRWEQRALRTSNRQNIEYIDQRVAKCERRSGITRQSLWMLGVPAVLTHAKDAQGWNFGVSQWIATKLVPICFPMFIDAGICRWESTDKFQNGNKCISRDMEKICYANLCRWMPLEHDRAAICRDSQWTGDN